MSKLIFHPAAYPKMLTWGYASGFFTGIPVMAFLLFGPAGTEQLSETLKRVLPRYSIDHEVDGRTFLGPVLGAIRADDRRVDCPHCGQPLFWRGRPPSGERICLSGFRDSVRPQYFACCAQPDKDGKRLFIFMTGASGDGEIRCELLGDHQVSWYYQRRLADLTTSELDREIHFGIQALWQGRPEASSMARTASSQRERQPFNALP
jgi:hypothetical protein